MSQAGNGHRSAAEKRILSFARRRFGPEAEVELLAGDASNRCFFRVRLRGLSPLVAMVHPEPFVLDELPWFLHARFLDGIGASVPAVVGSYPGEGILLVQDLGDDTLMRALESAGPSERLELYRQAVLVIAGLQKEGLRALPPEIPAARTALDAERLLFELRFFHEHYVESLLGAPLAGAAAARLDEWYPELAATVAGFPATLCHRDFHSRNLMVRAGRIYMVDFQDARMGPWLYDLASLLRDSYVDLPEPLVTGMFDLFLGEVEPPRGAAGGGGAVSRESALAEFDLTSLQRNIKAIGTFASQAVLRGKRDYLRFIPRTLAHVLSNLARRGPESIRAIFESLPPPPAA
ncbi:MAG TPA: phosphotransferase [Candidatus Saccharimonadales bacterium]|nr:phosphotransferase [Candidatus Saccharimonadales bacterium]